MRDKVNNERKQIDNDAQNKGHLPPGDPVCATGNPLCPTDPSRPATVVTSGNDLTDETTAWSDQQYKDALNAAGSVVGKVSSTGTYNWFNTDFKEPQGGGGTSGGVGGGVGYAGGAGGFAVGEALGALIKGTSIVGILWAAAHYSGGGSSSSSDGGSQVAAGAPDPDDDNWGDDNLKPGTASSQVPTKEELQQLRTQFNKEVKPQFWKDEAANNPGNYSAEDLARMKDGYAPIGNDGYPMEIHHKVMLARGGTNDPDNLVAMTRTEHRLGANYLKNHPRLPK